MTPAYIAGAQGKGDPDGFGLTVPPRLCSMDIELLDARIVVVSLFTDFPEPGCGTSETPAFRP